MTDRPQRKSTAQRRREIRRRRAGAALARAEELQTIDACYHPIGITYDRPTSRVRVACYTGAIRVYDDR